MSDLLIKETSNGWLLSLNKQRVSRCVIDCAFKFHFYESKQHMELRLERDFVVESPTIRYQLSASRLEELGPALGLFNQVIKSAEVFSDGKLRVEFEGGQVVIVEPDPDYEAWRFIVVDGAKAICRPGGDIAIQQPEES